MKPTKKICGLSTKPGTIKSFMVENLQYMSEHGYKSYCISNPGEEMTSDLLRDVEFISLDMKWGNVSPWEVLKCVWKMYRIFRRERFGVIQYATANAGLYAAIAGWLARVPVRVFLQWGIAYTDYKGLKLWFYKFMEKMTCKFSTVVQPDSWANLDFAVSEGLYKRSKGDVLGQGSACGVDLSKYDIAKRQEWRNEVINKYGLEQYEHVFGFVGRVVPEKGINELLEAFNELNDQKSCLLVVGPLEEKDRLIPEVLNKAENSSNIYFVGSVPSAEKYFAAFDYMVLPSYREGFGMVVLEAAGVGTPSIISNIKGPTDFVKDGENGIVCEVKSEYSLKEAMIKAINISTDDYKRLADNAYETVKCDFDSQKFKEIFFKNREELLKAK